jgi:hypothetical protein
MRSRVACLIWSVVLVVVLGPVSATAQYAPREVAAERTIGEAMRHFAADRFDRAEALLLGALKACGNGCSPFVKARLLMYVTLLRADARRDLPGARQALTQALAFDPCVELDDIVARDAARQLFAELVAQPQPGASSGPPTARFADLDSPEVAAPPAPAKRPGCADRPVAPPPSASCPALDSAAPPPAPRPAPTREDRLGF